MGIDHSLSEIVGLFQRTFACFLVILNQIICFVKLILDSLLFDGFDVGEIVEVAGIRGQELELIDILGDVLLVEIVDVLPIEGLLNLSQLNMWSLFPY